MAHFAEHKFNAVTLSVLSMSQACVLKYILDSADEQPKINTNQDNLIDGTSLSQVISSDIETTNF